MSQPDSWPMAGTCCESAMPMTWIASSTRLDIFRKTQGRPTLIVLDSHIGYGSPNKQDTAAAHGEPLGDEEIRLVKRAYGWPEDAKFLVPEGVYEHFAAGVGARGGKARSEWTELFGAYRAKYPELATEIDLMQRRELPAGWDRNLPTFPADAKGIAGRDASGKVLNALAQNIPWFLGGSADLGPSNKTTLDIRGRGRFPGRQSRRQEYSFWNPRARDGGDRKRTLALQTPGVRRHVFHLQRLRAARHSPFGSHGVADDFRLHPRSHGRRRRRADAPAGRAPGVAARYSRAGHTAPRGCQRSRGGLPLHHAVAPRARRAGFVAPAFAHAGSHRSMRPRPAWRRAHTSWPTPLARIPK